MGTILLKADINDLSEDNIQSYNLEYLSNRELDIIANKPNIRNLLLSMNIPVRQQDYLNDAFNLTKEECIMIMKNSDRVLGSLTWKHQYDIDVLNKYAHKLDLYNIENQESIDPSFVEKHHESMDMSAFTSVRERRGDLINFIHVGNIRNHYIRKHLTYRSTRSEVEKFILTCRPDIDVAVMNEVLKKLYDTPVNVDTLTDVYSNNMERANHSVNSVVSYYQSNHNLEGYANWEEFVRDARDNCNTALADVWFSDHHRHDILAIL